MSIRLRLIIIFLLISVVPIIILSALSDMTSRDALRLSIGKNFQSIAEDKARVIEEIFRARITEAEIIAAQPLIVQAVIAANKARDAKPFDVNMAEILQTDQAWIDAKGKTPIAARILDNPVSRFLIHHQMRAPDQYGEIFLTDRMGANLGMTKATTDYYQADEDWWASGFNGGQGGKFIDDRGHDESVGSVVTGVVVPIYSHNESGKKVAGVLKVNLKIKDIIDIISGGEKDRDEEVFLARSRGDVIFSSRGHDKKTLSSREIKIVKTGQSGWSEDMHRGVNTIMGYSPVSTDIYSRELPKEGVPGVKGEAWQKTDWIIFLEIPTQSAYALISNMIQKNMVISFLVAIFVIGLAIWFVGFFTRPIDQLKKGMALVAGGQLDYHLEMDRRDEIGDLARSFTEMTLTLNDTLASRAELDLSEKRFRSLVEHTSVVAWELDWSTFLFTYVSPHAEKLLGYPLDEWKTEGFWGDHIFQEDKEKTVGFCLDKSNAGEDHDFEYRMVKADGEPIWLRDIVAVNMGPDGVPLSLSGFMIDVTDRKNLEAQMAEKSLELEKSNQELQQFAYVASHDLQEPLRMVISYNQLLAKKYKGKLDAEADEFINFAVDGGMRMQALIKDLLKYSRVDSKAGELVPVESGEVLDNVLVILQAASEENKATITVEGAMPRVLADESQLFRLFQNLIGNSIKYKHLDRDPEISISAERKDGAWVFRVRDNGIGIKPEFFDRIFMIFQRLHTRDDYDGTGIGLAICHKIVERHGGKIWVESEPGEGSAFYFTLPAP